MSKKRFMKDFNGEKIFSLEYDKETLRNMVIDLQNQLQQKENIIKEVREYITGYESISIIQSLEDADKNKILDDKTMLVMTNRYLKVHDKLLEILDKANDREDK